MSVNKAHVWHGWACFLSFHCSAKVYSEHVDLFIEAYGATEPNSEWVADGIEMRYFKIAGEWLRLKAGGGAQ